MADTIAKKITRAVLFDDWGWKFATIFILGFIFITCFIFPNLHSVETVFPTPSTSLNGYVTYTFPTRHSELDPNWVTLGFRNVGIGIGGLIALVIFGCILFGIIRGFQALNKWSHNEEGEPEEPNKIDRLTHP